MTPNNNEWIKHDGGNRPVDKRVRVDVRLSNGGVLFNWQADRLFWRGAINNIIEYRIHVAEQKPVSTLGEDILNLANSGENSMDIDAKSSKAIHANIADGIIKRAVDKFLCWKLPDDFSPDGGIRFTKAFNTHTDWPSVHEPIGTNLFTAVQAKEMFEHCLSELSTTPPQTDGKKVARTGTALERYKEFTIDGEDESPIERLRFFCAQAMQGDDWLDVEPFFDALTDQTALIVELTKRNAELVEALRKAAMGLANDYKFIAINALEAIASKGNES